MADRQPPATFTRHRLRALAGTLLLTASTGYAQNLITNGSFDHDLTGWTASPASTTYVAWSSFDSNSPPRSTSGSANLSPDATTTPSIQQTVPVTAGHTYRFTFTSIVTNGALGAASYRFLSATGTDLGGYSEPLGWTNWQPVALPDATAPSGGVRMRVQFSAIVGNQASPHLYADNVSLLDVTTAAPMINTFTAIPSTITAGNSSTLSWTTTNATTVTISNGVGSQPVSGSINVTPTSTTTYTLTASNGAQLATAQATVTVTSAPSCTLSCTATMPSAGTVGTPVPFSATATPNNCSATPSYTWTFGDGTTNTSANGTHSYMQLGTYNWTLMTTIGGVTCQKSGTVTIAPGCSLACSASAPAQGLVGIAVAFTGAATASCTGTPAYTWMFGDGASATQASPSHIYTTPGSYDWMFTAKSTDQTCIRTGSITVTQPSAAAPPILFLYGYCGDTTTWKRMVDNLHAINSTRYSGDRIDLYYDGTQTRVFGTDSTTIPAARLYGIIYRDTAANTFGFEHIYNLHIQQLGYQLSRVIAAVRAATSAAQVNLVTHSMGGLVARTFVEGIASPTAVPPFVPFDGSVRNLIALDTPNRGTAGPSWNHEATVCFLDSPTVQRDEMDPTGSYGFIQRVNAQPIPAGVTVLAVATTATELGCLNDCIPSPEGDFVVSYAGQDLTCQASRDVGTTCQSIYDCQPNIRLSRQFTGDSHSGVHDDYNIALLVDKQLNNATTAISCAAIPAGGSLSLPAPTRTPSQISVLTSFTTVVGKQALANCTADIMASTNGGNVLAVRTIIASGTQVVTLGTIAAADWHIDVRPNCAVMVTVVVDAAPGLGRRRSVSH